MPQCFWRSTFIETQAIQIKHFNRRCRLLSTYFRHQMSPCMKSYSTFCLHISAPQLAPFNFLCMFSFQDDAGPTCFSEWALISVHRIRKNHTLKMIMLILQSDEELLHLLSRKGRLAHHACFAHWNERHTL